MSNCLEPIYRFYQTIDSTNDEAKRFAKQCTDPMLAQGVVFVSDIQTQGRGQHAHTWISDSLGGLYYSLLITTPATCLDMPAMTLQCAQSVRDLIVTISNVSPVIKAPNDVMIDGKKIAGILVESTTLSSQKKPKFFIIGIGINLNQHSFEAPLSDVAISLHQKTGLTYNKPEICGMLTSSLLTWLRSK